MEVGWKERRGANSKQIKDLVQHAIATEGQGGGGKCLFARSVIMSNLKIKTEL